MIQDSSKYRDRCPVGALEEEKAGLTCAVLLGSGLSMGAGGWAWRLPEPLSSHHHHISFSQQHMNKVSFREGQGPEENDQRKNNV